MTNNPAAPARADNPWAKFGKGSDYRMGSKTPAKSNPVESKCVALRITVERGKGYQAYRFLAGGSFAFFPCDLNSILKPLVGDLRAEDDMKVNWTVRWFIDAKGYRIVTRVADSTTGEVLAETSVQPALIETTIDENTGQLTTAKPKLDPFGKPVDPVKVAMRSLVNAARGSENDYDYRFDTNVYPRNTEVQMAEIDTTPLVAAAITQGKDDPTPTPSPDEEISEKELDKFFGKKPAKHFSEDAEWWKKADKLFRKYREAAIIEHRRTAICEWLEIPDMKQWDVMPEAALGLITAELDARFGAKAKIATPAPVKSVVPGYDPNKGVESTSNKAAVDSVGSVEPPIENKPPVGDISPVTSPIVEAAPPTNILPMVRTLTGISVLNIATELNKHLPPEAYGAIKYGQMSGKTDIDGDYVRDRFDQVFGPMGIGWRINPHKTAGRVEYRSEPRLNKEGKEQTWHIVTLLAHTLQYCMVMPDGNLIWVEASTTTDQHDNMDEQYAYRGALTSLTKQFYRLMGGMNHILHNEYTHVHAQAEIARRNRKVS
jgi:hypothetical protein